MFNRKYILKFWIFRCHVGFLGGTVRDEWLNYVGLSFTRVMIAGRRCTNLKDCDPQIPLEYKPLVNSQHTMPKTGKNSKFHILIVPGYLFSQFLDQWGISKHLLQDANSCFYPEILPSIFCAKPQVSWITAANGN